MLSVVPGPEYGLGSKRLAARAGGQDSVLSTAADGRDRGITQERCGLYNRKWAGDILICAHPDDAGRRGDATEKQPELTINCMNIQYPG